MTKDDILVLSDMAMVATLRWYVASVGGSAYLSVGGVRARNLGYDDVDRAEELAQEFYDACGDLDPAALRRKDRARDRLDEYWELMRSHAIPALMREAGARLPELPPG